MDDHHLYNRYQRQMQLKELGEKGQQLLLQAKVIVLGAGGLGCPALQYLAAAGVGTIGIVDDDTVQLHNLHRQVLYTVAGIGQPKAVCAATALQRLNPDINIIPLPVRLTVTNAVEIISDYDIVLDGTDNFATRYLINDACVLLGKPLVYGAIAQYEGQVAVWNVTQPNQPAVNYRDLFPEPPKEGEVLSCAEAGVIGILPGIIGVMQAAEVIKLITGIGQPLVNRLLTYNALTNDIYEVMLSPAASSTPIPKNVAAFKNMKYEQICAVATAFEIDTDQFNTYIQDKDVIVIDVREKGEQPIITDFDHLHVPLSSLPEGATSVQASTIILICQSGKRSAKAAQLLFDIFGHTKQIYSVKGGLLQWLQQRSIP